MIQPQPGPQTQFLQTTADIAFFGGSAGGGKTVALLLEPLRHIHNKRFQATIFRRTYKQIFIQGGLWDTAERLFAPIEPTPRLGSSSFYFREGLELSFSNMEHESDVYNYQGSAIPYIGFDEIDHFTKKQFEYMLSRNRSVSGVSGYIRGTLNPNPDSWVRKYIDWYIGDDGYAIPERSGKIRWFIRPNDEMVWANSKKELIEQYGPKVQPKSFTFIRSSLYDNKILMEEDPNYESNLLALPMVEREKLLNGNWNIRPSAGMYFKKGMFEIIKALPASPRKTVRYWDKASTKPSEANSDPDWTRGLKMSGYSNGIYVVEDVRSLRDSPLAVESLVKNTATQDTASVHVVVEQDPGSAGVADADNYVRLLAGYVVRVRKPTNDKVTRALPVSAQAERGNIKLLAGAWNDDFLQELENFPQGAHDDQVDVFSGAFNEFTNTNSILDVL